ncbi:MAG TPA: site-specific integrase, partial [Candidatus Saccharimonadia bacterium]|nr:site-specific integrase [Candidatus Saccharimonadia bacterium]
MATIQRRPSRGGPLRYRVQIRLRGQVRSATFATWQEARHWAAVTEGDLRTHRVAPTREALSHTLGE